MAKSIKKPMDIAAQECIDILHGATLVTADRKRNGHFITISLENSKNGKATLIFGKYPVDITNPTRDKFAIVASTTIQPCLDAKVLDARGKNLPEAVQNFLNDLEIENPKNIQI